MVLSIKKEILGLFDHDTFDTSERFLPADEVMHVKCVFKAKLNSYGGLDKLKARIYIEVTCSKKTPSIIGHLLLQCETPTKKRIFIILDKEYEMSCPQFW